MILDSPAIERDRFEIRGELGRGASGAVLRAWDRELECEVALKTIRAESIGDLSYLKHEFRRLATVHHAALVPLYELFSDGREACFSMELVDGRPFNAAVLGECTTLRERITAVRPLLRSLIAGLVELHDRKILHGDVKPENVLVTAGDRVVLLDFGLARALDDEHERGGVSGTWPYLAPEVLSGSEPGLAADTYSLGVLLYETLFDRLPIDPRARDFLSAKLQGKHTPVRELAPDAPDYLVAALDRMMSPEPSNRPTLADVATLFDVTIEPSTRNDDHVIVGRERERAIVRGLLSDATRPHVVTVAGPSGIGKSTFVRACMADARQAGFLIARGTCSMRESVPFGGFDAIVEDLCRRVASRVESTAALDRDDVVDAARIFPILASLVSGEESPRSPVPQTESEHRVRAVRALRRLLTQIVRAQQLLIVIDDMQWASADCAELFRELVDGDDAPAILWLVATRELPAEPSTAPGTSFTLPPLGHAEIDELWRLHGRSDAPPGDEAGGSPFIVTQLARFDGAATSLPEAVVRRMDHLDPESLKLVELVAISPASVPLRVLLRAAELGRPARSRIYGLENDGWVRTELRPDGLFVAPYHLVLADAIHSSFASDATTRLHRSLHTAYLELAREHTARLYEHALGGDRRERASEHAIDAAIQAKESLAFLDGGKWYERAAALATDDDTGAALSTEAAAAYGRAGHCGTAAELFLTAANLSDGARSLGMERRLRAAEHFIQAGDHTRGLALFDELFPLFGDRLPTSDRAAMREALRHRLRLLLAWRPSAKRLRRGAASGADDELHLELLRRSSMTLATTRFMIADCLALRYLRAALARGAARHICRGLGYEAMVSASLGGNLLVRRSDRMLEVARGLSDRDAETDGYLCLASASVAWSRGRWTECAAGADAAEQHYIAGARGQPWELGVFRLYACSAKWWLGDLAWLGRRVPALLEDARARRDHFAEVTYMTGEPSGLWVAQGAAERIVEFARSIAANWGPAEANTQRFQRLTGICRALLYLGDPATAWREIEAEWPAMKKGLYDSMAMTGTLLWFARGRVAVALAAEARRGGDGKGVARWTSEATHCARALRKKKTNDARAPMADLLEAAIGHARGQQSLATSRLASATQGFEHHQMGTLALACECHSPDSTIVATATARLAALGVREPTRFAATLAPGLGS